jgi:SAM-dependent methyltransferase
MVLVCPICDSSNPDDYELLGYGTHDDGSAPFPLVRCRRDAIEFANALPVSQAQDAPQAALDQLYGAAGEPSGRYIDFMNQVEAIVGPAGGRTLHDVGCGNGQLLLEALRRGWRVQGNDIVPSVRARIEAHGVRCFTGQLSELPLQGESCDVVTSFCVLPHHLVRPTPEMIAVHQMLKPGGWLILQLPVSGPMRVVLKAIGRVALPWGPTRLSRFMLGNICNPGGHQFAFTQQTVARYLRQRGFTDILSMPYRLPRRYTLARFTEYPWWVRTLASLAVGLLQLIARSCRMPNHSLVFARKPLDA